ncbi:hypothetical protein B0H17DRAFT_383473 [Mycena rosella]|uniref:Uncharacterized protein n=1 Tax=Mycena rosella TaxID=1033263 RepID=A0AAD7GN85_MYCRO|nr:hypothetical protein B0H17DRAFT_383473 [Mycena rosella]
MLRLLGLLPFLSILLAAAVHPGQSITVRQSADCASACAELSLVITGGDTDLASVCTDNIATAYASCYNCEASSGGISQVEAQQAIATFAQDCEAGGYPVGGDGGPVSIDGGKASPTGSTGGGGRSGSTPALPVGAAFKKTGSAVRTTAGLMGGVSVVVLLGFASL